MGVRSLQATHCDRNEELVDAIYEKNVRPNKTVFILFVLVQIFNFHFKFQNSSIHYAIQTIQE